MEVASAHSLATLRRNWLGDRRHDNRRISALTCGFGDISYFNRCFRRRFGLTPGSAR